MTNVTHIHAYAAAHPQPLPPAAPQQSGNVTTLQRALADGVTPAALRAVAARNERKGHPRNITQARALHRVASQLEQYHVESHREAA